MSFYRTEFIIKYFLSRGWTISREGNSYIYLKPKKPQKFPPGFLLEIPKQDNSLAFNNYIDRILNELQLIVFNENSSDDFKILFSKDNSILKYRVFDHENQDGSISFQKHIDSLDSFKKVLSQTVTFVSTDKQIFANAKMEVEMYLSLCKTLQTERGSFVSKFEVPNTTIHTAISKLDTSKVNDRLFDVIEFVDDQIIEPRKEISINENYISDNRAFVNYELLQSIRDIYSKTEINNLEFQLSSNLIQRNIITEKVQPRLKFFNYYLRELKNVLLNSISLEVFGKVKRLTSEAPLTSRKNEVILTAEIANKEENIKLILRSDEYIEAVEAHKNENTIRIKGKARQGKTMLVIYELEEFEII